MPTTRRELLAATASTALLGAVPALAAAQGAKAGSGSSGVARAESNALLENQDVPPRPPSERVGWAIVGLGEYATKQAIPAFADSSRSRLAAFVSGDREKARAYCRTFGLSESSAYTYDEMDRLRSNPDVQVGYVITPNATHHTFTERLANAGKHVFSEKPMEISEERCQQMIEVCRKAGVKLMIGYRAQYEPYNEECIRLCRSGELGRLRLITSEHGRQLKPDTDKRDVWRAKKALAGGGSLMDIGIYALNASMYLSGEEPVELEAREDTDRREKRFAEVEDTLRIGLRFPSGLVANLACGYSWNETKRYSVIGEKKTLDLDPATDYYEHRLTLTDENGRSNPSIKPQSQFAREIDHFSRAVQENTPIKTPGEMGLRDVRLMMRIYEAVRTGRPLKV